MDNRPSWVPKVEAALARGHAAYREAVDLIAEAMDNDPSLTQAAVAEFFGHKAPWVNVLLKWRRDGYDERGPFAAEIAGRRAKAKPASSIEQSEPEREYWHGLLVRDGPWRQQWLEGFEPDFQDSPPIAPAASDPEREAFERVWQLRVACDHFVRTVNEPPLSPEDFLMVRRSYRVDNRRKALDALVGKFDDVVGACNGALNDLRAALKKLPQALD